MKIAKIFTVAVVLLLIVTIVVIYVFVFTPFGNELARPGIEEQIKKVSKLNVELKRYHLSLSDLDIVLYVSKHNALEIKGSYSLFSQSFDLAYDVRFSDLKELRKLVKKDIAGALFTDGTIKGNTHFITIKGKSDFAKSNTKYYVELNDLNPTSIVARIKQLDVESLLFIVGEPKYASAKLDIDLNFKNIKPHQLDGDVKLLSKDGVLNKEIIEKYLKIKIPTTTFSMQGDAKLQKEDINYRYTFDSNLAKLTTSGVITPQPLRVDVIFSTAIKELALLKPITNADLQGKVKVDGTLKGAKQKMVLHLTSDVASSNTSAIMVLSDLKPKTLQADIKHLRIEELLHMVKQPHYADGVVDITAKMESLDPKKLTGAVHTLSSGSLNVEYLTKAYSFKHPMPKTSFDLKADTKIDASVADTKLDFVSTLANLTARQARFNINKGSIHSDYAIDVPSLEKLYFLSDKHLRGGIKAYGDVTKTKDITLTLKSNIAKGDLSVLLKNDDVHITLSDMRTKKVLWILRYPEIFDGSVCAQVDYNLAISKGVADAQFEDGKFVQNKVFDLLKKQAKVDLYREYFNGEAKADIDKDKIATIFDLKARKARIKSDKTNLDMKKETIDSVITLTVEKTPVTFTFKGDIAKPKVKVDLKQLVKSEAKKRLKKKVSKELDKILQKNGNKGLKNVLEKSGLLKGLF